MISSKFPFILVLFLLTIGHIHVHAFPFQFPPTNFLSRFAYSITDDSPTMPAETSTITEGSGEESTESENGILPLVYEHGADSEPAQLELPELDEEMKQKVEITTTTPGVEKGIEGMRKENVEENAEFVDSSSTTRASEFAKIRLNIIKIN